MPRSDVRYDHPSDAPPSVVREDILEPGFISRLQGLKYGNAVQQRVKCIDDDKGNGFVWHTIGRGKTLISYKASSLLKLNDSIQKCIFLVEARNLVGQLFYSTQIPVCQIEKLGIAGQFENN